MVGARIATAVILSAVAAAAAVTVEIKGRITNRFPEEKYRAAVVIVTDRLGVELGRTRPDRRGQYELKITGPRYIIVKAVLEGFPDALYQVDTQEIRESTTDREENKVFGEMRIPTYFQNITFGGHTAPAGLEELLAGETPAALKAYRAALAQKEAGDAAQAVSSLEKVIREHQRFYLAHIELGMLLVAQQQNDRALEVLARAQALRPEHPWAYVGLGLALNNKRDFSAAARYLEKAVALDPDSVQAQFQLGQAAFQLGDLDRARACLSRAIELEPKFNPLAQKTLAAVCIKKQDGAAAAQALESYLLHFPAAPDADKVRQILAKLKP